MPPYSESIPSIKIKRGCKMKGCMKNSRFITWSHELFSNWITTWGVAVERVWFPAAGPAKPNQTRRRCNKQRQFCWLPPGSASQAGCGRVQNARQAPVRENVTIGHFCRAYLTWCEQAMEQAESTSQSQVTRRHSGSCRWSVSLKWLGGTKQQ